MTDPAPEIRDQLPTQDKDARRKAILQTVGLAAYLVVVFGILLPSVIDYGEVVEAFAATPPQWLLVVGLIGIAGWFAEGLALKVLMPGLGLLRSVSAYLIMAAVGSTMPGPVKLAVGYRTFREWDFPAQASVLGLTLNSLATQAGKLLLPAVAILFLTIAGTFPGPGLLLAFLLLLPVALGIMVLAWVLRSEAFARRVGAFATRATGAVLRRINRDPVDLTDRLLDFRDSAKDLLLARAVPTALTQLLARSMGYFLLLASLRAMGVPESVLPADVILAVYAVVMAVTLLPLAPGGAGLPELLYISLFGRVVSDPAYDDLIAAGVMLMRGMSWFLPIPVGYVVLLAQRRAHQRRSAAGQPEAPAGTGAGGVAP
ncbi:MAG TPA: lysylphosphatidylglycerol synthase transmembrane domain-containing protein [Candidatus Limnocylindrales bacterium]|nr:lysylphosphatidylglycerol synthase transmembrane domain-containing protein [Candidatus Limnocylindrales bacterium]